jgi:hypothetical protein
MAKPKKTLVQFKGVTAIETAIITLGGVPYNQSKSVEHGLLGTLYSSRALLAGESQDTPITYSLTPEEFALVQNVNGVQQIK